MSKQANFFAIGIFVIAAFVIGVGTFIIFGTASLYRNTATFVATFQESANGLRTGAKVKAYGVEIGQVKRIMLHRVQRTDEVVIPVLMEIDLGQVSNLLGYSSFREFDESMDIRYLERDAKAQLQLESFVTGVLYVELIFGQEGHGFVLLDNRFADYLAVPTVPTDMQVLLQSIQSIASNLGQVDFAGLMENTSETLDEIRVSIEELDLNNVVDNMNSLIADTRSKINSPELQEAAANMFSLMESLNRLGSLADARAEGTLDQLNKTLRQLESTSKDARSWLDPSSSVYREVTAALNQVADASRSLRILVEYIERNPNALITGRRTEAK